LSLAREIARAHGGELRLDAAPGPKTTFVLTWPSQATG
jgi:signal transduction histidine kinase